MIIFWFLLTIILSMILNYIGIRYANIFKVLDYPNKHVRKLHNAPIPLTGGVAVFLSFFLVSAVVISLGLIDIEGIKWLGVFLASLILFIVGIYDDLYNSSPHLRLITSFCAVLVIALFGIQIQEVTNPFGGVLKLNQFYGVSFILTICWLLGMTYTTKLLDGIDGLVGGLGAIGAFIIFLLTMKEQFYQPDIGFLAILFLGSLLGFLYFNFHKARIFLGEGGGLFVGFMLGVFAIFSGSKIASTLLILGIPILDTVWIIIRRIRNGKHPFSQDTLHIHHRLLRIGFTPIQTVLILYTLSFSFGILTIFLPHWYKLIALGILFLIMILFSVYCFYYLDEKDDYLISKNNKS